MKTLSQPVCYPLVFTHHRGQRQQNWLAGIDQCLICERWLDEGICMKCRIDWWEWPTAAEQQSVKIRPSSSWLIALGLITQAVIVPPTIVEHEMLPVIAN